MQTAEHPFPAKPDTLERPLLSDVVHLGPGLEAMGTRAMRKPNHWYSPHAAGSQHNRRRPSSCDNWTGQSLTDRCTSEVSRIRAHGRSPARCPPAEPVRTNPDSVGSGDASVVMTRGAEQVPEGHLQ
jgi:hypothetical protein